MGLLSIFILLILVVVAIILIAVFIPASGKKLASAVKKGTTIAIDRLHDRVEREEKKLQKSKPRRMAAYDEDEVFEDKIDSMTEFFKTKRVDAATTLMEKEEKEFVFTPAVYHETGEKKGKLKNVGEQLCRLELERRFYKNFPIVMWDGPIKSPVTQHALELDCYNEEIKLALEFNGEQHYIFPSYYIKDRRTFEVQVWNDRFKREECERLGIVLIEVDGRNPKYNEIIDSLHMLLHGQLPPSGDINVWVAANPELFKKILKRYPARAD